MYFNVPARAAGKQRSHNQSQLAEADGALREKVRALRELES